MKKLFTLLTMLIVGIGSMWAIDVVPKTDIADGAYFIEVKGTKIFYDATNSNLQREGTYRRQGIFTLKKGTGDYSSCYTIQIDGKYVTYSSTSGDNITFSTSSGATDSNKWWVIADYKNEGSSNKQAIYPYKASIATSDGAWNLSKTVGGNANQAVGFYNGTDGGSYVNLYKIEEIKVSDEPTATFDANTTWYTIRNNTAGNYLHDNGNETKISLNRTSTQYSAEDLFCFVGNFEYGYKIYNLAAGVNKILSSTTTMGTAFNSGSYSGPWPVMTQLTNGNVPEGYNETWDLSRGNTISEENGFLLTQHGTTDHTMNDRGGLGFWSGTGDGSTMRIAEVSSVVVYTVVTNIDGGGVTYTPSYTGTATQAKGGFYVLASAPSNSDFTATAVENCTADAITVDATAKTITVHYTPSPIQVTDAALISSTKVYRLRSDRTAIYAASTSATSASGTTTASASTLDVEEPLNQWAFLEKDSKKYLYNVGAKKFLKTSPYVDFNTSGYGEWETYTFLEPYTTHEVQISTYSDIEGRFWLKDVKNNRTRVYNSGTSSFTINGWVKSDGNSNSGNGWIIEEIPNITFDPTEALTALDNSISYTFRKVNGDTDANLTSSDEERDVATGSTLGIAYNEGYYTPLLQLKDIKVNGTSSSVGTKTISNGDVIEWVYKCPFTVSDAPSAGEFAANTHWYFLNIHTGNHLYLNIPESFDYSNKIPANTTTKSINDGFLWCITGDNTDGYRLYNKRAGATKVMTFTSGTGAFISDYAGNETASLFKIAHSTWDDEGFTTGAPTFVFSGASARPNVQSYAVASWGNSDMGSEFTFEPVEDAILESLYNNYLPYFMLTPGYVGGLSWDDANMSGDLAEEYATVYASPTYDSYNTFVSHINAAKVKPVENAKYQIISAYPGYQQQQSVKKALYYDTSASKFMWKTYDASDESFTFQLRKTGDNWNIYCPSADKYLKECVADNNTSETGTTFTFVDLGVAQCNINDASTTNHSLHTGGHSSGAGVSGTITNWPGGRDGASAWYIAPIIETVSAISPAAVASGADVYQTFANPYDCQIANADVYYITTQTKSTAHIEQADNNYVPARTGVVLKAKKAATINIRPISGASDDNLTNGTNSLVAGDGSTTVAAGNYMLAYSSTDDMAKFYAIGSGGYTVPANKAYLPSDAVGARSLILSFDDDATGIQSLNDESSATDNEIYNVTGQKVSKMQRGIYIVNGKKMFVK